MEIDMFDLTPYTALYANNICYSDAYPYEIVRIISAKTIEVREMDTERDPNWKPEIIPGGFSGHCTNQDEQRWTYKSNPERPVKRIRLNKRGWQDKYGSRFYLSNEPRRFHDYNF